MTEKEMFLSSWERECATTLKVLKAYPAAKAEFKPHERSKSARDLAWTFIVEQGAMAGALAGKIDFANLPAPPATLQDVIAAFEKARGETAGRIKRASEAELNRTVKFPVGPKQMGDIRTMDLFWMMLMDAVHHRGQLSVYLRMVGGKVPSIYGPSADEPWM